MGLVSLTDLGNFLFNVSSAYETYLYFAFTLMMAVSILMGIRRILIGKSV